MKLAKVREELLQNILGSPKGRERYSGGPVKGTLDARPLPEGIETATKRKGRKPEIAFGRLVFTNPLERKTKISPSSAAASKEGIVRTSHTDNGSKRPLRVGSHVPPPPKAKPPKNRLGPKGEVMHKF